MGMMHTTNCKAKAAVLLLAAFGMMLLTGCRSVGPKTVARDRYDYSSSISESSSRLFTLSDTGRQENMPLITIPPQ